MSDFVIKESASREIARLHPDGKILIAPDLTPDEVMKVFPSVLETAAKLLRERDQAQAAIKDIQDQMAESGPAKPCPPSWKPEHWYGHAERCYFAMLMGLGHSSKVNPKWLVEQYRKHVRECKQPQCSCQFPVGTDMRTGKIEGA